MNQRLRLEQLHRSGALEARQRGSGVPAGGVALGEGSAPRPGSGGLEDHLPGRQVDGPRGSFFLSRVEYPLEHSHGPWPLERAGAFPRRWLRRLGRDLEHLDPGRLVFLDTETTGLSGGSGTYAFLVGLAWLEPGRICLEQLLMREHAEEGALLDRLAERLQGCGGMVTFNGKTFDLPLLQTRFVMKRLRMDLECLPHLDLLHPCRRVWGPSLPDCRLETLETRVLAMPREDDVPGFQIPELYFRFLRTGDGRGLARVAEHNRRDLLALMGLASALAAALEQPLAGRRPEEDFGLGRMLAAMGEGETGRALLGRALSGPLAVETRQPALLHLARLHRSAGDLEGATAAWTRVLQEDPAHPEAAEEMAKHLEHRLKDYQGALVLVERVLVRRDLSAARRRGLENRRIRLTRRLGRGLAEGPSSLGGPRS